MLKHLLRTGALAAVGCICLLGYVKSQWPAKEYEDYSIPIGRVEVVEIFGQRAKIIRLTNGFWLDYLAMDEHGNFTAKRK